MTAKLSSHIDNMSQLRLASITPGDVFLGEMEGVDHEKFFIVAGVSGDRVLCCSVLINSKINPFIMRRPHMLERQLYLSVDDYDFLSHESYINCAQPFKSRLDFFSDPAYKYKGHLSDDHIKQVQEHLITSGQLTQEEIDIYFLAGKKRKRYLAALAETYSHTPGPSQEGKGDYLKQEKKRNR